MSMPFFRPDDDPGPSFSNLLHRVGQPPMPDPGIAVPVTHATTCVAMRYADGVIMAGDRRATSGNLISHRAMEKVFPADRHSGIAIAGAAGPAHRDGQALPAAARALREGRGRRAQPRRQGEPAEPDGPRRTCPRRCKASSSSRSSRDSTSRRNTGRLFTYDVTGGRYEERDHSATGSGSLHAGTVIKIGYRDGLTRDEAVDLCLRALFEAADEDSATGGPDLVRGIFPIIATISDAGLRTAWATTSSRLGSRSLLDALAANPGGPAQ